MNGARIDEILATYVGHQIAGGCLDCDAYQEVERLEGVWVVHVLHDDGCPTLARHQRRAGGRP